MMIIYPIPNFPTFTSGSTACGTSTTSSEKSDDFNDRNRNYLNNEESMCQANTTAGCNHVPEATDGILARKILVGRKTAK